MVGVARILRVELPVAAHHLAAAAEDAIGAVERALDVGDKTRTEKRLERHYALGEGTEDHAADRRYPEPN